MMGEVLDAFLLRLAGEPPDRTVVVGMAEGGRELRAGWHEDQVASATCVSVFVEVPDAPQGHVYVVLCRWSDEDDALAYAAPRDGADLPRWKHVELTPEGVRMSVKWPREDEPCVYDFKWSSKVLPPTH